jgi:four helix bundle suffix protein
MTDAGSPLLPHGGYRKLRSYKVAEAVYDATVVFCRRFFSDDRRMADQMVQAARSGVRNISEGSGAAATSRKTEMKLTNVARASLADELLPDYESFLVQNGLRVWPKQSRQARAMRKRLSHDQFADLPPAPTSTVRLTGLSGLADFVAKAEPELAGNAMLCAVHQAVYLLNRQLKSQGRAFLQDGGFTENLYHRRREARRKEPTAPTAKPAAPTGELAAPNCPRCGKPMVPRTARRGPKAGRRFWGCSDYPDCTATRPMAAARESDQSDMSDMSDKSDPSDMSDKSDTSDLSDKPTGPPPEDQE